MNRPSFEDFAVGLSGAVTREAYLICGGDQAAAEDAVQEALIKAYIKWGHISRLDNPRAYVRRMVINECLTLRRRWRRRNESPDFTQAGQVGGGYDSVDDRQSLSQLLARLGPRQRAVLVLRYFCDMPDEHIAEVLGCSPATVRSQTSRALASLRRSAPTLKHEGTRHDT